MSRAIELGLLAAIDIYTFKFIAQIVARSDDFHFHFEGIFPIELELKLSLLVSLSWSLSFSVCLSLFECHNNLTLKLFMACSPFIQLSKFP